MEKKEDVETVYREEGRDVHRRKAGSGFGAQSNAWSVNVGVIIVYMTWESWELVNVFRERKEWGIENADSRITCLWTN
jgi:hypothetical protein